MDCVPSPPKIVVTFSCLWNCHYSSNILPSSAERDCQIGSISHCICIASMLDRYGCVRNSTRLRVPVIVNPMMTTLTNNNRLPANVTPSAAPRRVVIVRLRYHTFTSCTKPTPDVRSAFASRMFIATSLEVCCPAQCPNRASCTPIRPTFCCCDW